MKPVFLAWIRKHPTRQKRVGQRSCKSTYEFRPPAQSECRHEPNCWSPVSAHLSDVKGKGQSASECRQTVKSGVMDECLAAPPSPDETEDEEWEGNEAEDEEEAGSTEEGTEENYDDEKEGD